MAEPPLGVRRPSSAARISGEVVRGQNVSKDMDTSHQPEGARPRSARRGQMRATRGTDSSRLSVLDPPSEAVMIAILAAWTRSRPC
jgi:hypothetical protein